MRYISVRRLYAASNHNELVRGGGHLRLQPLGPQIAQRPDAHWRGHRRGSGDRRLSNDKPDDFALFTSDYFLDLWNKISGLIFILMFAVASVGLIVGGIGVMNIMLVSVTERTREIGVRKAIGAKRGNILSQFLIEAVTLSAVGGVIGVLFGSGLSLLMRYGLKMPAVLSFFWIAAALIMCALIGIVFGVYPAWKAARLDPVEALRYE